MKRVADSLEVNSCSHGCFGRTGEKRINWRFSRIFDFHVAERNYVIMYSGWRLNFDSDPKRLFSHLFALFLAFMTKARNTSRGSSILLLSLSEKIHWLYLRGCSSFSRRFQQQNGNRHRCGEPTDIIRPSLHLSNKFPVPSVRSRNSYNQTRRGRLRDAFLLVCLSVGSVTPAAQRYQQTNASSILPNKELYERQRLTISDSLSAQTGN
jgi:hypothetical protein